MARVFVSYRRSDSAAWAGRLTDRLRSALGSNRVFLDVADTDQGKDFRETVRDAMRKATVVVVLIGRDWSERDASGQLRISDDNDPVRVEISTALDLGVRIIPVLVDGASMPKEEVLPDRLRALATKTAMTLSHERWESDVAKLLNVVDGGSVVHHFLRWFGKGWRQKVATGVGALLVALFVPLMLSLHGIAAAGDLFFELLARGDVTSAYHTTSSVLRNELSEEDFQAFLGRTRLAETKSASWHSRTRRGDGGALAGTVTLRDEQTIPVTVMLFQENGEWRVVGLRIGVDDSRFPGGIPPDQF